ncbi:cell division protein SepF [Paenibacillus darwinianus]|uniref:Cell division protein SepF n=1 Tax=Paenibacillus darwinianus TaxID=1380763 RepID=A0A9W5S3Z9_9BACL|nr:cell division protein SepF [Paenibacillus darwinianus]EXX91704.1 cell division protein SepF [Paenibacillus darwinianus]EXX92580.1 cell division protein SepF [Paenibacillus darwinianus]EXX92696.1 cell division protein SepF [Paenibacillus darwinianus]
MSVMNRFMNFLGLQEEEEIVERDRQPQDVEQESETSAFDPRKSMKGNNVVSIHSQKNVRVVLNEPRSYDEAQEIADHLRSRRSVVVNLQRVRSDHAMRIIDFLSGTIYALNGSISKLGPNVFLCTPDSVEIQGSITDMLTEENDYNKMR